MISRTDAPAPIGDPRPNPSVSRDTGSALLVVLMLMILLGGFVIALQSVTWHQNRVARTALAVELAHRSAESGVAYFLGEYRDDDTYFTANPAPHTARAIGGSTFVLESAVAFDGDWDLVVVGTSDGVTHRLAATIGDTRIPIPQKLQLAGSGSPSNNIFALGASATIAGFDSSDAPFDPLDPDDATVELDGSLSIDPSSSVTGTILASGTVTSGSSAGVTGGVTENSTPSSPSDVDPVALAAMNASRASNDNSRLASIFGSNWVPLAGAENYGDLILSGSGTYVIPPGDYRFRKFSISSSATVIFDTSTGPSTLVYVGAGKGTGTGNDLTLATNAKVQIDAGGSSNGLMTVLANDCDLKVGQDAIFGQETTETSSGGYHQIIGLGGNASSDTIRLESRAKVYGRLHALAHELELLSQASWYGSAVARTAAIGTGALIAIDNSTLGNSVGLPGNPAVLATWSLADSAP